MTDHHVDRPEVYAQQCAQPTGPNRPNGSSHPQANLQGQPPTEARHAQQPPTAARPHKPTPGAIEADAPRRHRSRCAEAPSKPMRRHQNLTPRRCKSITQGWLRRSGGHGGGSTPDPIPNSDVKTASAHDTVPQGTGKSVAARPSQPTLRNALASAHPRTHFADAPRDATQQRAHATQQHTQTPTRAAQHATRTQRGVEQPGSSSGS